MHLLIPLLLAAAPPETLVVELDEVVVTATRTRESVLRAPAAISVVQRRSFADTRGISLKDALGLVPGVFAQSRSGAQDVRITIRGFGARGNGERSNAGNMRGIRVLTDGVNVTEPDGRTSLDLVDLAGADAIEVSRSNASVTLGNASGGVVNVRTDLSFAEPYAELGARAGSFGYHRETFRAGLRVGESRATVAFTNSTFDGWREHSGSATSLLQARLATPLDARTRLGVLLDAVSDINRFPGALTADQLAADPRRANRRFVARDERRRNRVGRVALSLDRTGEADDRLSLQLYVEPKALQRSERGRFRDFDRLHVGGAGTYEIRRDLGPDLRGRLSLGVDDAHQDGSILFYTVAPGGGRGGELRANKREAANGAGGFAEAELRWHERWSARVAARYDALRYRSEDRIRPELDASKSFRRWTPKGSLAFSPGSHTLYAALGGGIEAPAFNEIDPPPPFDTLTSLNPFLEPMHSTTWELGAKGEALRLGGWGRLRYDAALYWTELRNDIVPFDGGAYFFTAGRSRRRGVELGLSWLPASGLTLASAVTLTDNTYTRYRNELGDFSGNRIAGLPRHTVSGTARYVTGAGLSVEASLESVGAYFADDLNSAATRPYTLLDATIGYTRPIGGDHAVRAYVAAHNLTDERYVASTFINGVNGEFFEPGMPRNWSGGLTLRWR